MKLPSPRWFAFAATLLFATAPMAVAQPGVPIANPPPAEADPLHAAEIANQSAQAAYYHHQAEQTGEEKLPLWFNAALPVIGLVVGSFLTYWVAKRQAAEERERLYERQKAQVYVATQDLRRTLTELNLGGGNALPFLNAEFLVSQPPRPTDFSPNDPYYQKYDLVNLIYRLCALLGWMELYRNDPSFLNGPSVDRNRLEKSFGNIRKAFSQCDKTVNQGADGVILEDDQRASGEMMLTPATKDTPPAVLGYGAFCSNLFKFARWDENHRLQTGEQNFWIWNATRFVVDMGPQPAAADRRRARLLEVLKEITVLSEVLRAKRSQWTEAWEDFPDLT
ncbi:MAG: hypothetical protein INR62_13600 [Rhodospirillales bacterium]|nr:hypothetical protein [Acetobacter sp.]